MPSTRKSPGKRATPKKKAAPKKKWSHDVMEHSDAMDLEPGVFKKDSPEKIAESLKHSSEVSKRRKGTPFQSAMSMLNFYINRGGRNLSPSRKKALEKAKKQLRKVFHKDEK